MAQQDSRQDTATPKHNDEHLRASYARDAMWLTDTASQLRDIESGLTYSFEQLDDIADLLISWADELEDLAHPPADDEGEVTP